MELIWFNLLEISHSTNRLALALGGFLFAFNVFIRRLFLVAD